MDVEMLRSVEPLATAGKFTLARSIRDVDLLDVRSQVCRERERTTTPWVVTLVRFFFLGAEVGVKVQRGGEGRHHATGQLVKLGR